MKVSFFYPDFARFSPHGNSVELPLNQTANFPERHIVEVVQMQHRRDIFCSDVPPMLQKSYVTSNFRNDQLKVTLCESVEITTINMDILAPVQNTILDFYYCSNYHVRTFCQLTETSLDGLSIGRDTQFCQLDGTSILNGLSIRVIRWDTQFC